MEVRQTHKHTVMCLHYQTRLHSSRMRTARALTVSNSMLCAEGVYLVPGGCTWSGEGVYLVPGGMDVPDPRGCTWSGGCIPGPGGYLVLGGVPGSGGCTWSWG